MEGFVDCRRNKAVLRGAGQDPSIASLPRRMQNDLDIIIPHLLDIRLSPPAPAHYKPIAPDMPTTQFQTKEKYQYQNGFNSYHEYALPSTHPLPPRGSLSQDQKQSRVLSP